MPALLPQVFAWARAANPSQPLTSGVWHGDWSSHEKLSEMRTLSSTQSDVISFHNYDAPESSRSASAGSRATTARSSAPSTWRAATGAPSRARCRSPRSINVAAYNWGFVAGKTQTHLPWDSWQKPYTSTASPRSGSTRSSDADGTPYRAEEVDLIRELTGKAKPAR